jgi:hypothetical protein
MKTIITWRPYPEQKPDHTLDGEWLLVLVADDIMPQSAWYNEGPEGFMTDSDEQIPGVTHFALPTDIKENKE